MTIAEPSLLPTGVNAWGVAICVAGILIVAHQIYLDEVAE